MKKIILTLILILSMNAMAVPTVYPTIVEMNAKGNLTQSSVTLFNRDKTVKKYKISLNNKDNLGYDSKINEYITIFPQYIELKPGEKQSVKVLLKKFPINEFHEGEYRSALRIEEINSNIKEKYISKNANKNVSTLVNFNYIINMAIYVYSGELKSKIGVEKFDIKDKNMKLNIKNLGNYSYPLKYELLDKDGKVESDGDILKLMWNSSRIVEIPVPDSSKKIRVLDPQNKILFTKEI